MPDDNLTAYRGGKALRRGWTTGSCAAAASQAAAVLLLTGIAPPEIHLHTPGGITFCLPVEDAHMSGNAAVCTVRKDSGDDPDITNGVRITASVRRIEKGVTIEGGAGVGRITRPGLAMPVGEAAINPGPRQQIADAVHRAAQQNGYGGGFSVTISVKDGEALAAQTYNGHLGIVGGISILGTSGIVEPMSEKALVDTIRLELDSLYAQGQRIAFLCPGNYGADFARDTLGLDLERAVLRLSRDPAGRARRKAGQDGRRRDEHAFVGCRRTAGDFHRACGTVRRTARNTRRTDGCHLGGRVRGAAGRSESASARPVAHWQGDGNPHRSAHEGAGARGIHHVYRKIRRAGRVGGRARTL